MQTVESFINNKINQTRFMNFSHTALQLRHMQIIDAGVWLATGLTYVTCSTILKYFRELNKSGTVVGISETEYFSSSKFWMSHLVHD